MNNKYILVTVDENRKINIQQFSSYNEAWKKMQDDVISVMNTCDIPIMGIDYEINSFSAHVNTSTQSVDWEIEEVPFTFAPIDNDVHKYIILQSVIDWIEFERNSSGTYSYGVVFPSNDQIKAIATLCSSDDTEEIHKNCEKVLGINPDIILKEVKEKNKKS